MPRRSRTLIDELRRQRPDLPDPLDSITAGTVIVEGTFVTNPASKVSPGCRIVVRSPSPLRGEAKLRAALESFDVDVRNKVALDAGAAAGGFTRVLLEYGAAFVYAVDVGHGQLIGELRQHVRVANLEGANLSELNLDVVPSPIEVVTLDLSYLSLANAIPELDRVELAPGCDLIALVKPMFELHLPMAPTDDDSLELAFQRAGDAAQVAGWKIMNGRRSPVTGARGAPEMLLHARRGA